MRRPTVWSLWENLIPSLEENSALSMISNSDFTLVDAQVVTSLSDLDGAKCVDIMMLLYIAHSTVYSKRNYVSRKAIIKILQQKFTYL